MSCFRQPVEGILHIIHPWFPITETVVFLLVAVVVRDKVYNQMRRSSLALIPMVWLSSMAVDDRHMTLWMILATPAFVPLC